MMIDKMKVKLINKSLLVSLCENLSRENGAETDPSRSLTLRRLMSYTYMEHPFLMFLDHTQRRSTVGRTPLDE